MTRWLFQRDLRRRKSIEAKERFAPYLAERKAAALERKRVTQRDLAAYEPVDEVLATPSTRVLRAMRWFDEITVFELLVVVLEIDRTSLEYPRHRNALRALVKAGRVTRSGGGKGVHHSYSITSDGKVELADRIARAA